MKPTLELEDIIVALGIDLERYRVWEQKELHEPKVDNPTDREIKSAQRYELVV